MPRTLPKNAIAALIVGCLLSWSSLVLGFSPSSLPAPHVASRAGPNAVSTPTTTRVRASGFGAADEKSPASPKKNMSADFEYQELRIQLRAMKEQGVETRQLQESSRGVLEGYIRKILTRRDSPVAMYEIGKPPAGSSSPNHLAGTSWRLAYSSQPLTAQSLPQGVQVALAFKPDGRSMDYSLEFTKTFGLKKLTAESTYEIDSSPVTPGYVTYTYQKITTDVFGLTNLGIGNMGLLDGRSSQIQTVFFDIDGGLWIEIGYENGMEYFNVYSKEEPSDWS